MATATTATLASRKLLRSIFTWSSSSMRFSPPPPGSPSPCLATMESFNEASPPPLADPDPSKCSDRLMPISPSNLEHGAKHGAAIISSGGLIATPTDTVYGIAGDAQNDVAISRIYELKGRLASKPIAICVSSIDQVYHWGKVHVPRSLLEDLLPGPVTLVFERHSALNQNLNPNTNLIGIRIPDHKFIMSLFGGAPRRSHCVDQRQPLQRAEYLSRGRIPTTVALPPVRIRRREVILLREK